MTCEEKVELLEEIISDLKKEIESLKKDYLTQVYNRHYLDELLKTEYKEQIKIKNKWFYNLILIDLDNLHLLNREQGYEAGDEFIINVVKQIKNLMKEQNVSGRIFRIGGDEFVVIYQPYDKLNLSSIKNITFAEGYFGNNLSFHESIKQLDKIIIEKKGKRNDSKRVC